MFFSGEFNNYDNTETYYIEIGSGYPVSIVDPTEHEPSLSDPVVMFDNDPVVISCDRQDLTKRIIISQATINLISDTNLTEELFAHTNRDIPVSITNEGRHVFFGYVDPLQFNQGYAHNYEAITITATDPLGALEQIKVDDEYFNGIFFTKDEQGKVTILAVSPYNIITAILGKIGLTSGSPIGLDAVDSQVMTAMRNTKVQMTVFFGESQDDYYNLYDLLDEICKYFNLYISMYNNNSIILASTINQSLDRKSIDDFKEAAADDSTSLSVDDVYSQIKLTCKIEPVSDIIVGFDDKDEIYSDYPHPDKYMTEYVSSGEGTSAWDAFSAMIHPNLDVTDYDACWSRDYYMYALRNDAWDFGEGEKNYLNYLGEGDNRKNQIELLPWLAGQKCRAALVGFGRADENKYGVGDTSIQGYVNVDKYLVISSMGQWSLDYWESEFGTYSNAIQNAMPICKYKGLNTNVLSPTDNRVINYLIISGSILLNPLQRKSGTHSGNWNEETYLNTWTDAVNGFVWGASGIPIRGCWHHTVPITENGDGGYYQQQWHTHGGVCGIYGYLDNNKSNYFQYSYNYSNWKRDKQDKISKLPILACRIRVGDPNDTEDLYSKFCVERLDLGEDGINKFEWLTKEECDNLGIEPNFTIGIDPKIEDYIIGTKFPISNNVDYTKNIDATGTAIPITADDKLSGTVDFSILGPYNLSWDDGSNYTLTRLLFWNYAGGEYRKSVLNNIQSIMINSLKIDIKNNNGGYSQLATTADNDLVYVSATDPAYIETLENDISICTPPTFDECQRWGIKVQTSNSYVLTLSDDPEIDNTPFLGFPTGDERKPYIKLEECLVDFYYNEYNKPARMVETCVKADTFDNGVYGNSMNIEMLHQCFNGIYPDFGNFMLMSYESSLKSKTIDIKLRETNTYINDQI